VRKHPVNIRYTSGSNSTLYCSHPPTLLRFRLRLLFCHGYFVCPTHPPATAAFCPSSFGFIAISSIRYPVRSFRFRWFRVSFRRLLRAYGLSVRHAVVPAAARTGGQKGGAVAPPFLPPSVLLYWQSKGSRPGWPRSGLALDSHRSAGHAVRLVWTRGVVGLDSQCGWFAFKLARAWHARAVRYFVCKVLYLAELMSRFSEVFWGVRRGFNCFVRVLLLRPSSSPGVPAAYWTFCIYFQWA